MLPFHLWVGVGGIVGVTSNNHPARRPYHQRLTHPVRLLTVVLSLVLVTSTTACGGEPVEYFTPPPATQTPLESDEPIEDEPEVFERPDLRMIATPVQPSAANELSEDGARAFAYYFLEVLNYTAATGEAELLESISGPECNYCAITLENAREIHDAGQWIEGYFIEFVDEPEVQENLETAFGITAEVKAHEHSIYTVDGIRSVQSGYQLPATLIVYRLGNFWLVEDFGRSNSR